MLDLVGTFRAAVLPLERRERLADRALRILLVDRDLRLLAGATFVKANGGWFNLMLLGAAGAAEMSTTFWLSHDIGLNVAALGGLDMVLLTLPMPMARLTVGLTF